MAFCCSLIELIGVGWYFTLFDAQRVGKCEAAGENVVDQPFVLAAGITMDLTHGSQDPASQRRPSVQRGSCHHQLCHIGGRSGVSVVTVFGEDVCNG